ncbi:MAG: hypothetical protein A2Y62_15800 [Candidatus Fischerbacteria bacterium RBG_13_37_8]|uniref:TonB-dependent receptor-like beta-barrel domain-containing protein n=1 Tax=Candidatus Fischerbacteria bacterium RBG_13_37_8 TaxID=1817863 RepID=A0A1F5VWE8_9BACT|nr:MAG: hypothetical protein A2Y62_15800 [Candidatus Fischerbacteria bacterium RBG_13_37_8]
MKKVIYCLLIVGLIAGLCSFTVAGEEKKDDKVKMSGKVVTGLQGVKEDLRSSKFYEYRDVPNGFFFKYFEVNLNKGDKYLTFESSNVSLDDANYLFSMGKHGKYNVSIGWDEIPHRFSYEGKTLYVETAPGIYILADQIQTDAQNATPLAAGQALISNFLTGVHEIDLALYRKKTTLDISYEHSVPLNLNLNVSHEKREGTRPFGASLGFSHAIEVAEPIDYRTTNVDANLEYSKDWGTLRGGVWVSAFDNDIQTLQWDNFYRITDRTYSSAYSPGDGTSRGELALSPSNMAQKVYLNASLKLFKSARLNGSFSYGKFSQNEPLLPYTINHSIAEEIPFALSAPANSANAKANVANLNLTFTSKITKGVNISAGIRYYNFEDKTEELHLPGYVRFDQVWEEVPLIVEPYSYSPKKYFGDISFNLLKNTTFKVGYSFSSIDRKLGEEDEGTSDEGTFKASIDSTLTDWLMLRLGYQHSKREWSLDGEKEIYPPPVPGTFNFKRYHEANRDRDALNILVDLMPMEKFDVSLGYMMGKDDYPKSDYGLLNSEFSMVSLDLTYHATENTGIFAFYSYEKYDSDQKSRQSGSVVSTRTIDDWSLSLTDKANTFGGGFNTALKKDKVNLYVYYTYSKVKGDSYMYSPPGGTPDSVVNFTKPLDVTTLNSAKVKLVFRHSEHFLTTIGYWYEQYDLDDIARNDTKVDMQGSSGGIFLAALEPAYKYHVGFLNFVCTW